MYAALSSGSTLTTSGVYRVSHSTGHRSDANVCLLRGSLLPVCAARGCHTSYALVQAGHSFLRRDAAPARPAGDDR